MKGIFFIYLILIAGAEITASGFYPPDKALAVIKKSTDNQDAVITGSFEYIRDSATAQRCVVYRFTNKPATGYFYAVFTESKGRYEMFDYLVLTDADGIIKKVEILKYRSEFGGEIASRKWLQQFENYDGKTLQYGRDISAISGATISAGSLVRDVQDVIHQLKSHVGGK